MTLEPAPAVSHVLLAADTAVLAAAALRLASSLAPRGLERWLAAVPLAAVWACLQCLALGLVGLGAEPLALSLATAATLAIAWTAVPRPDCPPLEELTGWLRSLSPAGRAVLGAGLGVVAIWSAWMLRYPVIGIDGVTYHLPAVISWIQDGRPGSAFATPISDFHLEAYPYGNELLLTWPMAIARSFVPSVLWTPLSVVLIAVAGWHGLRAVGVHRGVAALTVLAVCALPVNVGNINAPNSDTPALAWTVCAAALATGVARRPGLIAPVLLAAALALGTKTTTVVPLLFVLGVTAYSARGSLGAARGPLIWGGAAAAVIGGLWYARNLIAHGSPFWPFKPAPWGDPSPPLIKALDHSLLDRPRVTIRENGAGYVRELAGGLVLIFAALLTPLVDRSRRMLAGALAAGAALLAYVSAPVTGIGDAGLQTFPILTLRYALPALAVCALAVALLSRRRGLPTALAAITLVAAATWSLIRDGSLPFGSVPSLSTLVTGAAAGAVGAVALAGLAHHRVSWIRSMAPAVLPAAIMGIGLLIAVPATGFVERTARLGVVPNYQVPRFFVSPGAPAEHTPVDFSPAPDARVAGDRLRRRLRVVSQEAPCPRFRRHWTVLFFSGSVINTATGLHLPVGPLERCRYRDRPVVQVPSKIAIYPPAREPERGAHDGGR
ncbi:MAG: hypothetical protein ACR2J6_02270 [Thermoleophilaceae bacterium]